MDVFQKSLELHGKLKGKISMESKLKVNNRDDLSLAYTPGVAEPCKEINKNPEKVYEYTSKGNLVAVVTDGTAVLGLGDIGPEAAMPVMEGKAILFKSFANIDAFPICLATKDVDEIVQTVKYMSPTFGGINLEDISAPRCFEIEDRLKKELDIPVFHDDQHGTAIVVLAGLINGLKLVNKSFEEIRVVISGAGSAGIAICKLLQSAGVKDIVLVGSKGIIYVGAPYNNLHQEKVAAITNPRKLVGGLEVATEKSDVFIGVSAPNVITKEMVSTMAQKAIVLPMANPIPEIMPHLAKEAGAFIVGTGRSDFPNQINNVLAFPGVFRGALDVRASDINEEMKMAAAYAIAGIITDEELNSDYIIPDSFNPKVVAEVAKAVSKAATITGVARR
ncbi:malate dehydrogenase (oxaloacetate-decarboxylating) [Alkaliphilus peptidifermentans DSM 18978]|uniref:Malate dehydrogenase (Oxaloacetate-decarboxylating) n=2 Tax=Alkaliphilus TaxID=114627 RepID=A0A1G5IC31_9FIRM|nr:malate dehydrogenase (oxaloacetate-decarboxylating) [Alkaliphilus peptidifermentans DSM 18978]